MSTENNNSGIGRHWKLAGAGGVVVAVVYSFLAGAGLGSSVLMGGLFCAVAGFVMNRNKSDNQPAETTTPAAAAPVVRDVADAAPVVADTAALPGQDELASRKGEWQYDAPQTAEQQTLIKPSAALPGQAELADRKGTWRYQANPASA